MWTVKNLTFTIGLVTTAMWVNLVRAEILHAYVLIEGNNIDQDRLQQGLGANLGMCKYVIVGSVATGEIGVSHTIVRLDCEDRADLNALIVQAGSGIDGVTRASVLETFREK